MQSLEPVIVHLLREGSWSDAVQLCREETGLPKFQARLAITRIADLYGIAEPGRTLRMCFIAGCGLVLFAAAGFYVT